MTLFTAKHIHLTGIKGVAMTSIAQCLRDLGKTLSGSDVAEHYVTQTLLDTLPVQFSVGFDPQNVPAETDLLIYTAAHNGPHNQQVEWAIRQKIEVLSQAEALSQLFNKQQGIAVAGVGGKSTCSAMLVWIFSRLGKPISFSVGVGNIPKINKTGQWSEHATYFVSEADEYVVDPKALSYGKPLQARFSFLQPSVILCTNLAFDHPDVYTDFAATKQTFLSFFLSLKPDGHLVINGDNQDLVALANEAKNTRSDISVYTFGKNDTNQFKLSSFHQEAQLSTSKTNLLENQSLTLQVPGEYNALNALGALITSTICEINVTAAANVLTEFPSTKRRFEYLGTKHGVAYYDDYAHHPSEIAAVLTTIYQMYPPEQVIIIFQPHTFSRTKALFSEFAEVLSQAKRLILTDIFASARESIDPTVSSQQLIEEIKKRNPACEAVLIPQLPEIPDFLSQVHKATMVVLTLGAGDIYTIHDRIEP